MSFDNAHKGFDNGSGGVPRDAFEAYRTATDIQLAHNFAGQLADDVGGLVLTQIGSPQENVAISNLLDGFPLTSDQFSHLQSRAYGYPTTADGHTTASPTSIDFAEQSFLIEWTGRFSPQGLSGDLCGNHDGVVGIEARWEPIGQKLQVRASPAGQATRLIDQNLILDTAEWHTIVVIADRPAGLLKVGGIDFEFSSILDSTGSLTSTDPFTIGKGRGLAVTATTISVRIALGTKVEGRSAKQLAQASAALVYWDEERIRASTAPK